MSSRTPPRFATALLKLLAGDDDALMGDMQEQFQRGKSPVWYWRQIVGIGIHDLRVRILGGWIVLATAVALTTPAVGWWGAVRIAASMALGLAITSWGVWRFQRTSLAFLYATSVGLLLPHWMLADHLTPTAADRVFWVIAQVLAGYGVVGVLLVPFLILRLGRSGPLADRPTCLNLGR